MFGKTGVLQLVLKKAMWFEVSVFPGLSLGPNPVLIVYSVLSITGYLYPERPFYCAVNVSCMYVTSV